MKIKQNIHGSAIQQIDIIYEWNASCKKFEELNPRNIGRGKQIKGKQNRVKVSRMHLG